MWLALCVTTHMEGNNGAGHDGCSYKTNRKKIFSDEQRNFDWIGVWTRDLWFDVPVLYQLSYPTLCWRFPKLSTIFARGGVPVRSQKSRIHLWSPRLPLPGFTMVHCLHRIQGVMIPGHTAFLGLWLLTGTPPGAKIVDNWGDCQYRAG